VSGVRCEVERARGYDGEREREVAVSVCGEERVG